MRERPSWGGYGEKQSKNFLLPASYRTDQGLGTHCLHVWTVPGATWEDFLFPENTCQAFWKSCVAQTLKFSPDTVCIYYPRVIPSVIPKQSFIAFSFSRLPQDMCEQGYIWLLQLCFFPHLLFTGSSPLSFLISWHQKPGAMLYHLFTFRAQHLHRTQPYTEQHTSKVWWKKKQNIMPDIITTRFYSLKCQDFLEHKKT